ncbi:hypothetical protein [Burkholderia pseudomallei]|uniref:hypothetical protein n=1 Tax=Burkholderia pseudomallei TaxID=28450 RepID=UPI001F293009|nr:hypothetical protein [Burkholderia pseudomallei]
MAVTPPPGTFAVDSGELSAHRRHPPCIAGPCFHGAAPGTTGIVRDAHGPTPVARRAAETGPARAEAGIMRSAAREPEPDEAGRARCADQWR